MLLYLTYIVPGSILFPLLVFVRRYLRMGIAERRIALYLLVSGLINLVAILLSTHRRSNLWLLHIYTATEAFLLLFFFRNILHGKTIRLFISLSMILFPLACVLNAVYFQPASLFNTYTRPAEALLCIALSAAFWLQDDQPDKGSEPQPWASDPRNWITTGLLQYFAGSFLLFLFSNLLLKNAARTANSRLWDLLWFMHGTLVLILYVLTGIGFLHSKTSPHGQSFFPRHRRDPGHPGHRYHDRAYPGEKQPAPAPPAAGHGGSRGPAPGTTGKRLHPVAGEGTKTHRDGPTR